MWHPKAQATKEKKLINWTLSKLKTLMFQRILSKLKDNPHSGRNITHLIKIYHQTKAKSSFLLSLNSYHTICMRLNCSITIYILRDQSVIVGAITLPALSLQRRCWKLCYIIFKGKWNLRYQAKQFKNSLNPENYGLIDEGREIH